MTKDEYEKIVPRIIEYMKATGEWGEFFQVDRSCYAYNETLAQEQMPLRKEAVLARGWQWKDEEKSEQSSLGTVSEFPDDIRSVPDDIVKQILRSTLSGKPYKIVSQELTFYREQNIPLPRRTPNERHYDRLAQRNKRVLYERVCMKCSKPLLTTYTPDSPETVYCEKCYLMEIL